MKVLIKKKLGGVRKMIGPGIVTGAADDDPSGIVTYSQAGAQTGFGLLWMAIFTFPLMVVIQEMCARIALVTGKGLAANIKKHFPKYILIPISLMLVIANTINIGANLSIMASVSNHLFPSVPISIWLLLIALVSVGLEIFISYKRYAYYLKWLTLILLSYIATALLVNFDVKELLISTFRPNFSNISDNILIIAAILGTTISPYLFFWQAGEVIEEDVSNGKNAIKQGSQDGTDRIKVMRKDVWAGMFFSNLIMYFIIAVCAETLFKNGITDITSATEAAESLRPLAGPFAYLLFSLGIVGTGLLAIPVLAGSSAYALSETFAWREGLYRKWYQAKLFYAVIFFSVIVGLLISLIGIDPIKSLIYAAVINGGVAPFIILIVLLIAGNRQIMGKNANGLVSNLLGWLLFLVMLGVFGALIFYSLQ